MQVNPGNAFNIEIAGNNFYIHETTPEKAESALTTLKKIEHLLRYHLNYDSEHPGYYSKLSKDDLYENLKQKAKEIRNDYIEEHSNPETEQTSEINDVFTSIVNLHLPILPLHKDPTKKVIEKMGIKELSNLSQVSHRGNVLGKDAIVAKIQKLGYEGTSYDDAIKYLEELKMELNTTWLFRLQFPVIKDQNQMDFALEELKNISAEKLISMCSMPLLYSKEIERGDSDVLSGFGKLKKFLSINFDLKNPLDTNDKNKKMQAEAICMAAASEDTDILKLLLRIGVAADSKADNGKTVLEIAKATGNEECIHILTKALEKPE